jgi:hypothetical protein
LESVIIRPKTVPEEPLFGIVEFSTALVCAAEALGQTVDISISGHRGSLTLPSLPNWVEHQKDPLHMPLLGPMPARTWKRGEGLIYWGSPISYPTGNAKVKLALLQFPLASDYRESGAQEIYNGFSTWLALFEEYIILLTTQNTHKGVSVGDGPGYLELLFNDDTTLRHISKESATTVKIRLYGKEEALHLSEFGEAARLSSQGLQPRLEYRMLLEAYTARKNQDFRKAIIEAANALEICLTSRILKEFASQGVAFGEKLLQKFRMLGGRFELVRILGISLPEKDYVNLVINPRNDVIHRASFPDERLANQVISEVVELLQLFSPQLHHDPTEV